MAEIVDKEFLRHIEPEHVYITTDKGHLFLKKGVTEVYESMYLVAERVVNQI
jgi:hypothetical protein